MAYLGPTIQMSGQEVRDFLARNRKAHIATLGIDGLPHLTTVFYVLWRGRVSFWTYGKSQKAVNLGRNSAIGVLIESGETYEELKGISIRGRVQLITGYEALVELGSLLLSQNTGGELDQETLDSIRSQALKRVGVIVQEDLTRSWDHSKLPTN